MMQRWKKKDELEKKVFSWSVDDILNDDLYKHQVEKIPLTFQSEEHYLGSFVHLLLEETRAELASSMKIIYKAPNAGICSLKKIKDDGKMMYEVTVGNWRNKSNDHSKEPYRTLPGDLLILVDGKPESLSNLQRVGRTCVFSLVNQINDDGNDSTSTSFEVKTSQQIEFQDGMFAVFLINITTNKRIWNSLHMHPNTNIIKEILYSDSVVKECCNICSFDANFSQKFDPHVLDRLNESQARAIREALRKTECCHSSFVEQIWGPPGTGKTTTVSVLLFILLQMKRRTLTCTPTNVAVVQVATRVLNLVKGSFKTTTASGDFFYCIGDVLLLGNKQRLNVGSEIEDIYLENRVKKLTECLGSLTGWKHCIKSMIDLLDGCVPQYHVFVDNELLKEEQHAAVNKKESKAAKLEVKSFIDFVRDRFNSCVHPLRRCILSFLTHISRSFMGEHNFQNMVLLLDDLSFFQLLLFKEKLVYEELEQLFTSKSVQNDFDKSGDMSSINLFRMKSLSALRTLQTSLEGLGFPSVFKGSAIEDFCFQNASLIFCTTSTSYKLRHAVKRKPLEVLVIDEAAQLKEAESIIPLHLPAIKHAILIGDECQLPAMVSSTVCSGAGFGRSLFGRLTSLGHSKHLLEEQYRMHPSISFFPNRKFYENKIRDAKNVTCKSYRKQYLPGPMFGSYSFINVVGGREEKDEDDRSRRNMVEVAIVIKIVQNLFKAWQNSRKRVTIGVVSPYGAQVDSIQEKLAHKYEKHDGFSVTVNTIDGFQGGEEDIIIISTVRSNSHGSVGFLSSDQRTNVALTRARHCLWILGNERTLSNSDCVWKELVCDARNRGCLFDADADKCLKMTIIDAKKELGQLDDLVNGNSVHFKHEKWKVLFSDDFRKSFGKLTVHLKKAVLNLLLTHSGGWRPKHRSVDVCRESSSKMLNKIKVDGLYVIYSIDIIKEVKYTQVIKVWNILPSEEISDLTIRIESIFSAYYTDDYINRCTTNCFRGNLKVPKVWPASEELIKFRYLSNHEDDCEASVNPHDGRTYVQNSKVNESLLFMKFYSLSPGVVSHLLSGKELDISMQVTDEQMDVILLCKSSFIIGRPGTGKTTILTMKLFQNEQNFRVSSTKINESKNNRIGDAKVVDNSESSKPSILRQLFVTVNPKLCYDVKQHVSHFTSISCLGNSLEEINLEDTYFTSDFNDIPDTFVEISVKKYPLVITFHKFLMMLDGTLGSSYFERFLEAKEGYQSNHISLGSVALQTFIRLKEVTFDRFCSLYWPHFNSNHKKKLDPSQVFTEIIFHIKGGMQVGECNDGKMSFENYCLMSESCSSTLSKHKRENAYSLFQAYENMKTERGEFDLADLVNDLHHRLKIANYEGDQMDFIYIDEVQDLSMRQISLFKYICQNVDTGFTFAGDAAQIIARGSNFRFQDLRSLFYKEFLSSRTTGKQNKSLVSEIFQLKQNFRTHASVLNLAQSVIDIMYCYFAHSIDILEPEISLIHGEAPVLLESVNDEKSIVTIFGGSGSGKEVGFGAEQVILVRDDIAKTEICEYIGKQTLVLTIEECKGLEFQDVLLYDFFGTSPFKDRWKVIYGYMKEQDWLDEKLPQSFSNFSESRHGVLCSELKLLYVAITRTRQRLWIYENNEELSKPMFDYWKRRGLVQVRKLDRSVAHSMIVASSPQEWKARGEMLFYENNFVMATMCFERAGDRVWETLAKASGLRASGDQIRGTNHEAFISYVREAVGMFESIGKLESAASCFCDLGEYETAGKIYMYKCGRMDEAAECFTLAGCYSDAAKAYAKGDKHSKCLSVCKKGKLFDKGLQYIEQRKKHVSVQSKEIELIEQEFLESCALYYHEHKDPNSMMKFIGAFCSIESKRVFLRSLGCLDHLLLLEEELGNFLDAAELARSWGDVLKEADLLEKAGHFIEATFLLLWYVFFSSLWGNGNKGWPVKQFPQKEELCGKAKLLAKAHLDDLYDFVCSELKLLSDDHCSLLELTNDLHVSQKHKSLRGEILLIRKIVDSHISLKSSKYDWDDELPIDNINKHCEEKTIQNRVSVRTLLFYWNAWKENVMGIFSSLESFHKKEPDEYEARVEFIFNYFGVRKQCVKGNAVYMLVNEDADWIRNTNQKGLQRDGKLLTIDIRDLVDSMRSYWQSELISVGIKVLETLERLLQKSKSNGSAFHQSTSLLHIFEVSKFLLNFRDVNPKDMKKLERCLRISSTYFDLVFPLDWRRSVSQDLISLRETDLSLNLLEEIIRQTVDIKGEITNWAIGRVMMICLGSRKPVALYEHIVTRIQQNLPWKSFFETFTDRSFDDGSVAQALHGALGANYAFNWGSSRSISPHSFVYLLESLLFMTSFSSRIFFTTRSTFVGLFTHIHSSSTYLAPKRIIPDYAVRYIVGMIEQILVNKDDIVSWIQRSNMDSSYYHPLLSLKLVMILSIICLQVSDYSRVLLDLLTGKNNIAYLLPKKFVYHILRRRKGHNLNLKPDVVAEAFVSIEDPLLIVCAGNASPGIHAPYAIFVDPRRSKKDILNVLFLRKTTLCVQNPSNNDDCGMIREATSSSPLLDENLNVNPVKLHMNWQVIDDIAVAFNGTKGLALNNFMIKRELDKIKGTLATALADKKLCAGKDATVVREASVDLKLLSSSLIYSIQKIREHSLFMKTVQGFVERLQSRRSKIDDFLNHSAVSRESNIGKMIASGEIGETSEVNNDVKETGDDLTEVENQSSDGGNTQDAGNDKVKKKRSRRNRGNKKFCDESKICSSTVEIGEKSAENNDAKETGDDLAEVDNQSGDGGNNQDAENEKVKKKRSRRNRGNKKFCDESKICSSTVEIGEKSAENNDAKETGDDLAEGDNQSGGGGNTQDAENENVKKKRSRRNRGNKKFCDESKICSSTVEIGEKSAENNDAKETGDDLAEVDNQSGDGGNNQDAENEKGKKRRTRRSRGKKN